MGHYGRIDLKLVLKHVKVVILAKVASKPYAKTPLLMSPTNMDPKTRVHPKGFKLKEAWRTPPAPRHSRHCGTEDGGRATTAGMGTGVVGTVPGTGTWVLVPVRVQLVPVLGGVS